MKPEQAHLSKDSSVCRDKTSTDLVNPTLCLLRGLYIEQPARSAPRIISPCRSKEHTLPTLTISPAKRRAARTTASQRGNPEAQSFRARWCTPPLLS